MAEQVSNLEVLDQMSAKARCAPSQRKVHELGWLARH
jgi:hypothetical protein